MSNDQPRLVHFVTYASPYSGAVIAMLQAVFDAAAKREWAMDVVFPEQARGRPWIKMLADAGVNVHLVDASSQIGLIRILRKLLPDNSSPTVLHTHFTKFDLPVLAVAKGRPATAVFWHLHSYLQPELRFQITNRLRFGIAGRLVERILCVAPHLAEEVAARGAPRSKILVVRNGIDTARFPLIGEEERISARRELGIPIDQEVVLHFAWDWHIKGGDLCLEALAELHRRGRRTLAVSVGSADQAESLGNKLGLGDSVMPTPAREDVELLFAAADVFVSPSRFEGAPTAVLQALSCGLPVVATRTAHPTEDPPPLLLLAEGDAGSLADAIERALEPRHDGGNGSLLAHQWVHAHADLHGWGERMIGLYEDALARR